MDGHYSHDDEQINAVLTEIRVKLVILPPHTTHFTQPLDVFFFKSVKQIFRTKYKSFKGRNDLPTFEESINNERLRILDSFQIASDVVGADWNSVKGSFQKCAIYPFDPEALLSHRAILQSPEPGIILILYIEN